MLGWTGGYCSTHGTFYTGECCPECAIMKLLPGHVDELEKLVALLEIQNQELNEDLERWIQRVIKLEALVKAMNKASGTETRTVQDLREQLDA